MPRSPQNGSGNHKTLATPQSVNGAIKSSCDIMRRSNCAGALQYVPELTWILFLRILDEREMREAEEAEAVGVEYTPSLQAPYRWRDWAAPDDASLFGQVDGALPTGWKRRELQNGSLGVFFGFVNGALIPHLKKLREQPNATPRQKVISEIFSGVERTRSERSWTVTRPQIEAKNYDLKALNPHVRDDEDTPTPEELLNLIESKGREVTQALAALRMGRRSL